MLSRSSNLPMGTTATPKASVASVLLSGTPTASGEPAGAAPVPGVGLEQAAAPSTTARSTVVALTDVRAGGTSSRVDHTLERARQVLRER